MEAIVIRRHAASIGIRSSHVRAAHRGEVDDSDVTRFENDLHRWASHAKASDVGVPEGDGWRPVGNPHVDAECTSYVVQVWERP